MFVNTVLAATSEKASGAQETISFMSQLGHWGLAFFIFLITFPIAAVVKKIITNRVVARSQYELNKEVVILLERVIYFLVVTVGTIIAFSIVGIDLSQVIGFLGLGIGFAFKDLLANFIAGVVILTQKKFKIGDLVKIEDRFGRITQIDVRTTQVQALDGTDLIIPNSDMIVNVIQNFTANSLRRISFTVGVHYSTPLNKAVETAMSSLKKNKEIVSKPVPQVLVTQFSDSSIDLEVRFWIESSINWYIIRSEVIQELKKDFDAAGITIPFPIRTLTLDEYDKNLLQAVSGKKTVKPSTEKPAPTPTVTPQTK